MCGFLRWRMVPGWSFVAVSSYIFYYIHHRHRRSWFLFFRRLWSEVIYLIVLLSHNAKPGQVTVTNNIFRFWLGFFLLFFIYLYIFFWGEGDSMYAFQTLGRWPQSKTDINWSYTVCMNFQYWSREPRTEVVKYLWPKARARSFWGDLFEN